MARATGGGVRKVAPSAARNGAAAEPAPPGERPSREPLQRRSQFEALAVPLADMLYATALRLCGNTAKAEDLVQETYVRAWQNFDRFTLGTNFKAWVFQILTFIYKNERRSAKSRELAVDYAANETLEARPAPDKGSANPNVANAVDWDALYPELVDDRFKRALDHLDEDQRAVLLLVTLGELSYRECANALEIPIGTVMSRLFRARKQMQAELQAYAVERGLIASALP